MLYGCIGMCSVAYLAKVFAESLREQFLKDYCSDTTKPSDPAEKQVYKFEPKEVLCAQIAGLCHDLGKIINRIIINNIHKNDVYSNCN